MKSRLSLSSSMTIKLAVVLSLSLTTAASSYSFSSPTLKSSSFPLSLSSSPAPKATAGDLLSLLGPKEQASNVDLDEARELRSCFKFLVPFEPAPSFNSMADIKRRSMASYRSSSRREKENQLIWWPPAPVLELAHLAFDSGGDPDAIHRTLDPSIIPDRQASSNLSRSTFQGMMQEFSKISSFWEENAENKQYFCCDR